MATGWTALLGYPVAGERGEQPLLACWILVLASFVVPVLPLVPVVGYLVRVLVAGADDDAAPAFLAAPVALLRRGVGGLLVAVASLLVPAIAVVVTVYGAAEGRTVTDPTFATGIAFYAGSTAVLCLALAGAYLCPVALYGYGRTGSLRGAVDVGAIRRVGGHAAYFTRWATGLVVLLVASAVASAALGIPRAGPVVAALLASYGAVLATHLWGRGIGLAERR